MVTVGLGRGWGFGGLGSCIGGSGSGSPDGSVLRPASGVSWLRCLFWQGSCWEGGGLWTGTSGPVRVAIAIPWSTKPAALLGGGATRHTVVEDAGSSGDAALVLVAKTHARSTAAVSLPKEGREWVVGG